MRYETMPHALTDLRLMAEKYRVPPTVEGSSSHEKMVLVMSYHDVDRLELTQLVKDFSQRLKELGVELDLASLQRG